MATKKKKVTVKPLSKHHVDALQAGRHSEQVAPDPTRKHLEWHDLRGTAQPVTIEKVIVVPAYSRKARRVISHKALKFKRKDKYLILRDVVEKELYKMTGTQDIETWENKRFTIFAEEIMVKGAWTPVIRLRKLDRKTPAKKEGDK